MILGYQQLVVSGDTLGVLGLDYVQQLLIDHLLLLLQPHIDNHLTQREVVDGYAGADGQPQASKASDCWAAAWLDSMLRHTSAPQVRLPTDGQGNAEAVLDPA